LDISTEPTKPAKIAKDVETQLQQREKEMPDNPFARSRSHISKVRRLPIDDSIATVKPRVRFAFISLSALEEKDSADDVISLCGHCQGGISTVECLGELLHISSAPRRTCRDGLDVKACRRRLFRRSGARGVESWRDYKKGLTEAIVKFKADIVVVNELGIPIGSHCTPTVFLKHMRALVQKRPSLIIAGSFHDARTKYNTGYILTPKSPAEGYIFHKQVSAVDVAERVSVPPSRRSTTVTAFGFRIGVIVCLDLLDYSTIGPLVDMRDALDFVLVPTHSQLTEPLEKIAKIASGVMCGGVGIVNYDDGEGHKSSMHLFGEYLKPTIDQQLSTAAGWLKVYDFDWQGFTNRKRSEQDLLKGRDPATDWLFRYPIIEIA
jgi:hypothetical protein